MEDNRRKKTDTANHGNVNGSRAANGRIKRTPDSFAEGNGGGRNAGSDGMPRNTGRIRRNIGETDVNQRNKVGDSPRSRGISRDTDTAFQGRSRRPAAYADGGRRMDIMDQTPTRRRNTKERKQIDPDSPEVSRIAKESRGYRVNAPKSKRDGGTLLVYAFMFLLVFIITAGVCAAAFYVNLVYKAPEPYDYLRMKICLENEMNEITSDYVDLDKYVRDGEIFINMTDVAEKFNFVITGDGRELKFITDLKTGENVKFILDTPIAEVNGVSVRLNGTVTRDDGDVFVPKSFIEEYVNGIILVMDDERPILSVLRETSRNNSGRIVESVIDFKLKNVKDSQFISEFDLSDAIKDKCYYITIAPIIPEPAA